MSLISKVSDASYALSRWWWLSDSELYQYWKDDYFFNAAWATRVLSIFLVLATATIVARWWRWSRRERSPLPPGPRGLPIVGNLPFIGTELHRSFAKFAETYGPIMKLRLGSKLCIVVTSPSLAKEVFKDQDTVFANHDLIAVAATATYGGVDMVYSPYGDHWRMLRKICVSEMLNHKRLEALYGLRRREVRHMASQIYSEVGSPIDVGEKMFLTTFNVITRMLWGDTLEGEEGRRTTVEVRRVMDRVVKLLGEPNISDLFPVVAWLDIQGNVRRMKKEISWFDRMLDSVIEERLKRDRERERGSERREGNEDGKQAKDLLQILLQQLNLDLKDKEGSPGLTISHIKALFLDMMVAETESTSSVVEWALAELLKHPHIMKKAEEELEEVVGLKNMVEESHLPKLHYLHAVVKEVLRLHPPAPFLIPRCPSASCNLGGFMVPKGSKVIVNACAIQRDPMAWDNPLEFQPERFLKSDSDEHDFSGTDFRYIPFGSGRRICVGIPMAERMVPYLLASALHSFQWKLPNDVELDMSDKFGMELKKATPLVAIPSPRLFDLTLYN
ncbi:flavonoid 3',5'-hydroxylase-like [Telopea speciosissima]|uniref:flavonoid 3',5'-hydroxylase-like n=1 Tax=Telopea speciosissima TaxID=54955 RepID=UPI001CC51D20|nr:flavonoid 3',5'-hydroxylase-like [Telopea speciosissima]